MGDAEFLDRLDRGETGGADAGLAAAGLAGGELPLGAGDEGLGVRPGLLQGGFGRASASSRVRAFIAPGASGAQARWPALHAKARAKGDRAMRAEAFEAMAAGEWELAPGVWQKTEPLLWKPPAAWFSISAFFTAAGLRNWYVNFERPVCRTETGFDTLDLTVGLVIDPGLSAWTWKDEDRYAPVRRWAS